MSKKQAKNTWYPLDNAGVLYSAIQKDRYSAIYRFSAVMTEPVNPTLLQRAVGKTCHGFLVLPFGCAEVLSGVTLSPTPTQAPS